MLEKLRELSMSFLKLKFESYRRYFIKKMALSHRCSIILGERGVGKTTTVVQYLMDSAEQNFLSDKILYVQSDHFMVRNSTLYEIAESFYRLGGKHIAFDEIHKYGQWSMELKSIYDTFPDLTIIASGSSALEIHKGSHDLTRRALMYRMYGLSFREFIELSKGLQLPEYSLEDIIQNHSRIAFEILDKLSKAELKILKLFKEYCEYGYYPFFRQFKHIAEFKMVVEQNLHTTIESDLMAVYPHLTGNSIKKIKQLIIYLAQAVPFTPNWQTIRQMTDISDDRTIKTYFKYLEDASIIAAVGSSSSKMKQIEDPEKIYLGNTNQLSAFALHQPDRGNLRETFFISNVRPLYQVSTTKDADFVVEKKYYIEVGGKNKDAHQIKNYEKGFLALDDIEHGSGNRIPLWLFGFLY